MKHPNSPMPNHYDIAVIGGGASGMAAAWYARRCMKADEREGTVALFERNDRVGKKLLMTGNGRCNLTNTDPSQARFHGTDAAFSVPALSAFPPARVIELFNELGVVCVEEDDGRMFPASLHAASVLDALRLALDEADIRVQCGMKISAIAKERGRFTLAASDKTVFTASAVIVATGGACAPSTGSDGGGYRLLGAFAHDLIAPLPSIVQLRTDTTFVKPLSGNKINGTVSLVIDGNVIRRESGEILFTDYGLSGPPVLQLSGHVSRVLGPLSSGVRAPGVSIELDFLPGSTTEAVGEMLHTRAQNFASRKLEEYLTGLFHRRLAYGLLKAAVNRPLSAPVKSLSPEEIDALTRACKQLPITVLGTMPLANAQTTAGGVATAGFNPATMESYRCANLYACGEVLDIDGDCGGFNLQWAWASGFLAGASAAAGLAGVSR